MDSSGAREVKVVLLGDVFVGKTSLAVRFVTDALEPYSESTIGASFMSKLMIIDGAAYKYQIWDTAGQEKYHSLAPMYYRNAAAALLVYDITNAKSFGMLKQWVGELKKLGPENIIIVVCGNKADLEAKRVVSTSEAAAYASEVGALFYETSAYTRANVHKAFESVVSRLPPLASGPSGGLYDDAFYRSEGGGGGRVGGAGTGGRIPGGAGASRSGVVNPAAGARGGAKGGAAEKGEASGCC